MRVIHQATELDTSGCVLVPTMGALHAGHLDLVRLGAAAARERGLGGGCVVSVFVNPTQFDESTDYERYPRTLEADAAGCEGAGAAAVYAPAVEEVYPAGAEIPVPPLPVAALAGLEDAHRPGHFEGVCQVVLRLFELTGARAAVFGEKDWQQLIVARAMSASMRTGVEIIAGETTREPDGLAMSSRNRFLSEGDRAAGLGLSRALAAAREETDPDAAEAAMRRVLAEHGIASPDYAAVRDAETLGRPVAARGRALVAARVGSVRLLDNCAWGD